LNTIYVYVTDGCNCACKHCWIYSGASPAGGKARQFLAPEALEAAITEAKPLGLRGLKWTGGEPTIHPDFPALLDLQKKHGLGGRLETNGMEVTPALAELLNATGVKHVAVSIDGASAETHDTIRGTRGGYKRALNGIRNLTAAGFKPQIIMSLMRENSAELEELLGLAKTLGAGSVKLNIIQPTLRGEQLHTRGETLSVRELIELHRRVARELQPASPFPIHFDIPLAFRPLQGIITGRERTVCGIMTILGLLADGSYALCGIGENMPEMVFGRAGAGELAAIWKSHPVLRRIREGLPAGLTGICGRCLMKSACLGNCVAQNYYRSNDILGAYWFCELAEQEGLFPVTRMES
jgi:SynChlorMet cassette radical SAM/SPASM protein ScmF